MAASAGSQGMSAVAEAQDVVDRTVTEFDVVVAGAGFAGMYMLHRLRGLGLRARVIDAATGVGGTWYWNRYPGARCDVESMSYSYSFDEDLEQEWVWTERFPTQPEILRYANHVADRFDLRRDIQFETRVTSMVWDETASPPVWRVETDAPDSYTARYVVAATGCLSASRIPDFPGLDSFGGQTYHTGQWPHEGVDFTGKRVGVVGTGSSAIQSIPVIASQADHVTVFQRTANFSVPANNRPLTEAEQREMKENYRDYRRQARESQVGVPMEVQDVSALDVDADTRTAEFEARWKIGGTFVLRAYNDLTSNPASNDTAAEFVRSKIRQVVEDPETAELLSPRGYPVGTKRICVDTDYYRTFNLDHVDLVDIRNAPITEITPTGLRTAEAEYDFDAIVFATGFDAMTGALLGMNIVGRAGEKLADKWEAGPRTYLGVSVAGFPNLFTITGPGSPSVLSNMMVSIEQHVEWISDALAHLDTKPLGVIEAQREAEDAWVQHVAEVGDTTLYPQTDSWYVGANIPGKPRVFMPYVGGVGSYRQRCEEIAANGYEGFAVS